MDRLVSADRRATVTQITTVYNCGEWKNHLRTHNTSDFEADGLQQQKATAGSAPVRQGQESEATMHTRLAKTGQFKTGQFQSSALRLSQNG